MMQQALELTEERKADLELLQMRGVLDPKRFYKRSDKEGLPKYFQVPSTFMLGRFGAILCQRSSVSDSI